MKKIALDGYARKSTYEAFRNHEVPVLSVTCEIDISALHAFQKGHGLRFFPLLALLIDRTINQVDEFRHRVVDGTLYEYERVHPSFTALRADNTISFCDAFHEPDIRVFYDHVIALADGAMAQADLEMRDKNDRYFISNVPWLRFTSFNHPYNAAYASIPIVTTGKFVRSGTKVTLPVALQAHHGLVDGYHLGRFYGLLEENMARAPELLRSLVE